MELRTTENKVSVMQTKSTWVVRAAKLLLLIAFFPLTGTGQNADPNAMFEIFSSADSSTITARHESGSFVYNNRLYALGGRQFRPVEFFDPVSQTWTVLNTPPFELNHFQPVEFEDKIYAIGAFECCFPQEDIHPTILIYDPVTDVWETGSTIPPARLRGSAGAVLYDDKIYFVGGNTLGHNGGAVPWFDVYDPVADTWQQLPDAPNARDHFFAAIVDDKLVAASGRQSAQPNPFANTISAVDVYDFATGEWSTGNSVIPTVRAGAMVVTFGDEVIFIGGEVDGQRDANNEVESFNPSTNIWRSLQPLVLPSHTGVAGILGDTLHVVSGSDIKGGGGENSGHQIAQLGDGTVNQLDTDADGLTDSDEINIWQTDPANADTDGDGLSDGVEVSVHESDPTQTDSDGDGLDDFAEVEIGSDVNNPDTDGDTLTDGAEVNLHMSSPLSTDTDADFLPDDQEVNIHGTNPDSTDTDADGLDDTTEVNVLGSNPNLADTDADGLDDNAEVNVHGTDPLLADSDNDGVSDSAELAAGLNPLLTDSDGDGVEDAVELNGGATDGDDMDPGGDDTDGGDMDPDGGDTDGTAPGDNTQSGQANTGGSSGGGSTYVLLALVFATLITRRSKRVVAVVSG